MKQALANQQQGQVQQLSQGSQLQGQVQQLAQGQFVQQQQQLAQGQFVQPQVPSTGPFNMFAPSRYQN